MFSVPYPNVNKPILQCKYEDEGCNFQGKTIEVEQHQQDCLFSELQIEDMFSIPRFDLILPECTETSVLSIPVLNLILPDSLPTSDAPTKDYKPDYDKLVEESRNLMNSLKATLECPVCLCMVRSSPVPSCYNGHIVCSSCWNRTHLCPLCRVKLHETEKCFSQTANKLLELVSIPCRFENEGCSFQGRKTMVEQHQQDCLFRHVGQEQEAVAGCPTFGCRVGIVNQY